MSASRNKSGCPLGGPGRRGVMLANYIGYKAEIPNGKQVLFIDCPPRECVKLFQRWDDEEWEPIDCRIFDHTKLPPNTIIKPVP